MYFHVNISLAMSNKYVIFYVNSVLFFYNPYGRTTLIYFLMIFPVHPTVSSAC